MFIVDWFKKNKGNQTQASSQSEKQEVNYQSLVQSLFTSYLVNSYSHYIADGGQPLKNNFTEQAKHQPLTFEEYCNQAKNPAAVMSDGAFNLERMQLDGAHTILTEKGIDQKVLEGLCGNVSTVYECALATSVSSQQKLQNAGEDPSRAELNYAIMDGLKRGYETGHLMAFTSKSFEREGVITVDSAREQIETLNTQDPEIVPWALDTMKNSFKTCQNVLMTCHSDFVLPEQQ